MTLRRSEILQLLDELEASLGAGFLEAIAKITSNAQIERLVAALESGNIEAIMQAAGMRAGSWGPLTEPVRNAYITGGAFVIAADVPKRFGAEFNISNPRAENWLREYSSKLVTFINSDQRDAIQTVLEAGLQAGRNPRSVALDIVGRVSQQTGRRVGGIVGLNAPQASYVVNARKELESLDPKYFTRTRRDKRFDGTVRKAIETETPLDAATVDRLTGRYSDRLLQLRGETIGRTEALTALNESADEALRQVIEEGLAPPDAVKRIWRHSHSPGERPGHLAMSGQERGINEAFENPLTGVALMHPGDGPASETINCRCVVEHKIDFIKVELAA